MTRECPNGDCVIGKTEQSLAVLKDPKADQATKAEALKFVIHFVGDMHQPCMTRITGTREETTVTLSWTVIQTTCIGCGTPACSNGLIAIPRLSRLNWKAELRTETGRRGLRAASRIGCWRGTGWPRPWRMQT
jgi:hypothetical protein